MAGHDLSLYECALAPGQRAAPPAGIGALYVLRGAVAGEVGVGEARLWRSGAPVVAGAEGAEVLLWWLGPGVADPPFEVQLRRTVELPAGRHLLRCDRVEFPPGGVAYTHTHRGPGIRRLVAGTFRVWVGEEARDVPLGGSWFEAGPDPVYAEGSRTETTAFVRVMVLPDELAGKSSISYVKPEDRDRPKDQRYTVFLDEPLDL